MRVLLTGARGALGKFVERELILFDHEVISAYRSCARSGAMAGDLTDLGFVKSIGNKYSFDCIVHCAGIWNGRNVVFGTAHQNILMMLNLLSVFGDKVNNFVFISSSAVYEDKEFNEDREDLFSKTTYGLSKLQCEQLLKIKSQECGLKYTIWRPVHIVSPLEKYQPGSSHVCTDTYHKLYETGMSVDIGSINPDLQLEFTWVEDIARCIVSVLRNCRSFDQVFNIASKYKYSVRDIIGAISDKFNGIPKRDISSFNSKYSLKMQKLLELEVNSNPHEWIDKFFAYRRAMWHRLENYSAIPSAR